MGAEYSSKDVAGWRVSMRGSPVYQKEVRIRGVVDRTRPERVG